MKRPQPKSVLQVAWDAIGIPARLVVFPPHWLEACGWTTLEEIANNTFHEMECASAAFTQ